MVLWKSGKRLCKTLETLFVVTFQLDGDDSLDTIDLYLVYNSTQGHKAGYSVKSRNVLTELLTEKDDILINRLEQYIWSYSLDCNIKVKSVSSFFFFLWSFCAATSAGCPLTSLLNRCPVGFLQLPPHPKRWSAISNSLYHFGSHSRIKSFKVQKRLLTSLSLIP